jgi:hypothetical protein
VSLQCAAITNDANRNDDDVATGDVAFTVAFPFAFVVVFVVASAFVFVVVFAFAFVVAFAVAFVSARATAGVTFSHNKQPSKIRSRKANRLYKRANQLNEKNSKHKNIKRTNVFHENSHQHYAAEKPTDCQLYGHCRDKRHAPLTSPKKIRTKKN